MHVDDARACVLSSYTGDVGRFYAPGETLALGKGLILSEAPFAIFDPDVRTYRTAIGTTYVLTHECDVETENDRSFNEDLLVCPLMPLADVLEELQQEKAHDQLISFFTNLGARNIPRLIYLPPVLGSFPDGAVMFLNRVTNAPAEFVKARSQRVCALTAFGVAEVEYALEHHLLRPKADRLAFAPYANVGAAPG